MHDASGTVFCSIVAQADNLGDIAICQAAIDISTRSGLRHVVFSGRMPDTYVKAFAFPAHVTIERSAAAFVAALIRAVLARQANLLLSPGPYRATGGLSLLKACGIAALVAAVRMSGGSVIAAGRAIRGDHLLGLQVQRWIAQRSTLYAVRDRVSPQLLGLKTRVAPDLALSRVGVGAPARDHLAISLRGDRTPNLDLLREIVTYARAEGLHPTFVTQVRRDNDGHAELADALGIAHVEWGDRSHSDQLLRVQEIYARTHTVVSDRLHALIFGLQYCARPVALKHADPDKLVTTLADVVPLHIIDAAALTHGLGSGPEAGQGLDAALNAARSDLQHLQRDITAVLRGTTNAVEGESDVD